MMRAKCDACGRNILAVDYEEIYLCDLCREEYESENPLLVNGHLKWKG
jgi:hypothetical protein